MDIRDLLVRHEKLVHLNEGNKDGNRPRKTSSGTAQPGPSDASVDGEMLGVQPQPPPSQQQQPPPPQQQQKSSAPPPPPQQQQQQPRPPRQHYAPDGMAPSAVSSLPPDPRLPPRAATACNLDVLSDAATHLATASEVTPMQPMMADLAPPPAGMVRVKGYVEVKPYGDRGREPDPAVLSAGFPVQPAPHASFEDYHLFLDEFASSPHFLPPSLETEPSFGVWSRSSGGDLPGRAQLKTAGSFPSTRFPSLQPDPRDASEGGSRLHDEMMRAPAGRISAVDHTMIKNRLEEFSSVVPPV